MAFAHRLLEANPAATVEVHLRACSECRQVVALLAKVRSTPAPPLAPDAAGEADEDNAGPMLPERLLTPGTQVGRYILLKVLGTGGMGVVYAAYDPELARTVALKLLRGAQVASAEARARLQREARAMARLTSPYVLPVHDVGTWHEQVFLTMELVEGGTLTRWLAEKPRRWNEVLALFLEAGRGLAAAHAAGLVHRDFKPDNVLVGKDGRARVTDFGLARSMEGAELPPEASGSGLADPGATELTQPGAQMGTPAYMSPEQGAGRPVDARSDQFSFCVALHEALCGKRPALLAANRQTPDAAPRAGGERSLLEQARIPAWLRRVVLKGLSPEPQGRFASMEELLHVLEAHSAGRHRRWGLVAGAVVLVLAAVGVTEQLAVHRAQPCQGAERKLEGIWDVPVREAAEAAFLATGRPYAATVWKSVATTLDGYTVQWTGAHVEACEATRLRGEQSEQTLDLRMACLERRRRDLGALTKLLSEADAELLGRALQATHGLPAVADCADVETLRARPLLPEREPQRSQAEALRQRLAEVRALFETGKYARGMELVPRVLEEAHAVGFAPLKAEALLRAGKLTHRVGRAEEGKKLLLDAVLAAHAASRPELAAEGYLELTYATYSQPEEAQRWVRFAAASITASGDEPQLSARLRLYEAMILGTQGRLTEALDRMRQSTALWERATGPDSEPVGSALSNTASVLFQLGRYAEALPIQQRAIALEERAMGPEAPSLVAMLQILSAIQGELGDTPAAMASAHRALDIAQRTFEPGHPWFPAIHGALGAAFRRAGRYPEALEAYQRGLALGEKLRGVRHISNANILSAISDVLRRQGHLSEALGYAERALQMARELQGPDSASAVGALGAMAASRLDQGQVERARELYQEALAIRERLKDDRQDGLGETLTGLGRCLVELGHPEQAVAPLERALGLWWPEAPPEAVAETRFALARALEALGREPARARALAEEARADFQRAGLRAGSGLDRVQRWLQIHPPAPRP